MISIRKNEYSNVIFEHFKFEMNLLLREASLESNTKFSDKICVAVSGGSDSTSLLLMASEFAKETEREVICVTVDHKLRVESASEAEFVARLCKTLSVEHHTLKWNDSYKVRSVGKLEIAARKARYALIRKFCEKNRINVVLLGHTLDDQMETFLLRKQSGSSNIGLAGISKIRRLVSDQRSSNFKDIFILRPIMSFRKSNLKNFLNENEIQWKNDPMNDDTKFRRVLYRRKIMNYNAEEVTELSNKIKDLGISRRIIETDAVNFLKKQCEFAKYGYIDIPFYEFLTQETEVQCEILRRVLWDIGGKNYPPNISQDILQKIISNSLKTFASCFIKCSVSKNLIRVVRERRNLDDKKIITDTGSCILNNFLIKVTNSKPLLNDNSIKYVVSYCSDSVVYQDLSKEVCAVLPYVCVNEKIIFAYGSKIEAANIKCEFLHRADLFDIFLH